MSARSSVNHALAGEETRRQLESLNFDFVFFQHLPWKFLQRLPRLILQENPLQILHTRLWIDQSPCGNSEEDIVDTATLRDPKPVGVLRVTVPWLMELRASTSFFSTLWGHRREQTLRQRLPPLQQGHQWSIRAHSLGRWWNLERNSEAPNILFKKQVRNLTWGMAILQKRRDLQSKVAHWSRDEAWELGPDHFLTQLSQIWAEKSAIFMQSKDWERTDLTGRSAAWLSSLCLSAPLVCLVYLVLQSVIVIVVSPLCFVNCWLWYLKTIGDGCPLWIAIGCFRMWDRPWGWKSLIGIRSWSMSWLDAPSPWPSRKP